MEDHTATIEPIIVSTDDIVVSGSAEIQPSGGSIQPVVNESAKPQADPVASIIQNVIDKIEESELSANKQDESEDQTLDRDQTKKNPPEIEENIEKNDESSSTTSDDSDNESSSSSMHLGLANKKSKMNDLDEDDDLGDNKPIRSTNELKVHARNV